MIENNLFKIEQIGEDIRVTSKTNHSIKPSYFGYSRFMIRGRDDLKSAGFWSSVPINDVHLIRVIFNNEKFFFYGVKRVSNKYIITDLNKTIDFDFNLPITFFTGSAGGGTSIVVKLLRHLGIHFGDDCGDINSRKTHESISMLSVMDIFMDLPTFLIREKFNSVINLYNYRFNKINCFKKPYTGPHKIDLIKLSEVFPNIKFVTVIREPNNFFSSNEGKLFNKSSKFDLMDAQRPLVEGNPLFNLDFIKFFTDYNYVNKVLRYLGSNNFLSSDEDLNKLKNKISFDERVLNRN